MTRPVCVVILLTLPGIVFAQTTRDLTEYRTATYGPPDYYADPTKSLAVNGDGTLGNPWNLNQAKANAVAGDVVGILPSGDSPVDLVSSNNDNVPTFNPTNSGTLGNPIVFVTRYAAVALSDVATNANRTEFRHDGTAENGTQGSGTGSAMLGSNAKNYIIYDGFYIDQAQAWMKEDSGNIRSESATGVEFRNFVIKGAAHTVYSNCVIYRPQDAVNTVLSNFKVLPAFTNSGGLGQPALFSDQYGDQNFLIEHFDINGAQNGIFPKGMANSHYNYGTIRYGVIRGADMGIRANALDTVQLTTIHNVLIYNYTTGGFIWGGESDPMRNLLIHHLTLADGSDNVNQHGPFYLQDPPGAAGGSNVTIRDCIGDFVNGSFGLGVDAGELTTAFPTMNYNGYYRGGGTIHWSYNGVERNTIADWRTATGQEAQSLVLASDPFTARASADYTVADGHAAKTASSTGGELGAYGGTTETIGPVTAASSGGTRPRLRLRIGTARVSDQPFAVEVAPMFADEGVADRPVVRRQFRQALMGGSHRLKVIVGAQPLKRVAITKHGFQMVGDAVGQAVVHLNSEIVRGERSSLCEQRPFIAFHVAEDERASRTTQSVGQRKGLTSAADVHGHTVQGCHAAADRLRARVTVEGDDAGVGQALRQPDRVEAFRAADVDDAIVVLGRAEARQGVLQDAFVGAEQHGASGVECSLCVGELDALAQPIANTVVGTQVAQHPQGWRLGGPHPLNPVSGGVEGAGHPKHGGIKDGPERVNLCQSHQHAAHRHAQPLPCCWRRNLARWRAVGGVQGDFSPT